MLRLQLLRPSSTAGFMFFEGRDTRFAWNRQKNSSFVCFLLTRNTCQLQVRPSGEFFDIFSRVKSSVWVHRERFCCQGWVSAYFSIFLHENPAKKGENPHMRDFASESVRFSLERCTNRAHCWINICSARNGFCCKRTTSVDDMCPVLTPWWTKQAEKSLNVWKLNGVQQVTGGSSSCKI